MFYKTITRKMFLDEIYEVEGIRLAGTKTDDDETYTYPHYKGAFKKPLAKGAPLDELLDRIHELGVEI